MPVYDVIKSHSGTLTQQHHSIQETRVCFCSKFCLDLGWHKSSYCIYFPWPEKIASPQRCRPTWSVLHCPLNLSWQHLSLHQSWRLRWYHVPRKWYSSLLYLNTLWYHSKLYHNECDIRYHSDIWYHMMLHMLWYHNIITSLYPQNFIVIIIYMKSYY